MERGIIGVLLVKCTLPPQFQNAEEGDYKGIWDKVMEDPASNLLESQQEAIDLVSSDVKVVYIDEVTFLNEVINNNCELELGKEQFYKSSFAFPVPQGFPYMSIFNER